MCRCTYRFVRICIERFTKPSNKDICSLYYISVLDDPSDETEMTEFKASVVAFEVQKNFASKFFSNKTVVKSLIDDTSGNLLDNLYLLLYVFVSKSQDIFTINILINFQTKNKKESEKTTRNIIKISIKLGMLQRGEKIRKG